MERVVVTGATSMIGAALIQECIQNNVGVLAVSRKNSGKLARLPKSGLVEVCECNLDGMDSIGSMGAPYDVFYHFAWEHTEKAGRDDPVSQERNIKHTLDAVRLAGRLGCSKFIGAGSQAEYGHADSVTAPDTPVKPAGAYGAAKYAAGELSRELCRKLGMTHIWARIFSVYGRNDNEGSMLTYAIDSFLKGQPAKFSSAVQMWNYLHEEDAGRILYLIGELVQEDRVYCVASEDTRPLKEYILELAEVFGQGAEYGFSGGGGKKDAGIQPDISSLTRDIGYRPRVSFKEGIKDMALYRKHIFGGGGGVKLNGCSSLPLPRRANGQRGAAA